MSAQDALFRATRTCAACRQTVTVTMPTQAEADAKAEAWLANGAAHDDPRCCPDCAAP